MPNEIYHRSEWGNPKAEGFGDVYFDASATNKLYKHSDNYENSDGTDKILRDIPNKASIVLTPTAYSDGSLNTVIPPYQVLPQELVTNGTFDTDSDWTLGNGWSISGGKAILVDGLDPTYQIYQSISGLNTKNLKVTFDVTDFSGDAELRYPFRENITGNGSYTFYGVGTLDRLQFQVRSGFTASFSIDNVSVKEVQEADFDFSRGSSATRVNEKGLIEDVASNIPRIDYTSGQGALLLEPQSTNLITYSEDFSEWSLGQSGAGSIVLTSNNAISPDGNNTADKLVLDMNGGTTSSDFSFITISYTSSVATYTLSCYLKGVNGGEEIFFDFNNQNNNLITLTNEWVRYDFTKTISTPGTRSIRIGLRGGSTTDDTASFYMWGAQLEQKSFATSYIPTEGATVTRSADVANNSGNADLINSTEGVLYAEISALANDGTERNLSLSDGTSANRISWWFNATDNLLAIAVYSSSNLQYFTNLSVGIATNSNKIAFKYKQNNFSLYVNGVELATDTNGITPIGLSKLSFNRGDNALPFYGNVKCVAVFKEADIDLEKLTS